jgi:hypothetical protein
LPWFDPIPNRCRRWRYRWAATLCRCSRRAATPCPTGATGGLPRSAGAPGGPPRHAPPAPPVYCQRRGTSRRARRCSRRFNSVSRTPWRSRAPSCAVTPFGERGDAQDGSTPCRGPRGTHGLLRAPRRLSANAAMLTTVQLRVEDPVALTGFFVRRGAFRRARRGPVALTGFFVRRDALRRARRCSRRFNSVSRMPLRSRAPSCAATPFGERGDAQDGLIPCRGHRGAHGLLRAPRRLSASATMLRAPRCLSASAAMLKTVQLRVEDPVALTGFFVRRDAFRPARRCSRRFNSVSRTPLRSWAPQLSNPYFNFSNANVLPSANNVFSAFLATRVDKNLILDYLTLLVSTSSD